MKDLSKKNPSELRKQHNHELIRRMRNGESLNTIDSKASWFPPRPIIQKDRSEMARLYHDAQVSGTVANRSSDDETVVPFDPSLGEAS